MNFWQAVPVAGDRCLVPHPVRLDRMLGPEHDDRIGLFQRFVDRACEARSALDQLVPPDLVPALLQSEGDGAGARLVGVRIAQEHRWLVVAFWHGSERPRASKLPCCYKP